MARYQRLTLRQPSPTGAAAVPPSEVAALELPGPEAVAEHSDRVEQLPLPRARMMVGVLGAVLLIAGLIFGFVPVSTTVSGVECGSAFAPDYSSADRKASIDNMTSAMLGEYSLPADYRSLCHDALPATRIPAIMLTALGAVTLLGVGLQVAAQQTSPRRL